MNEAMMMGDSDILSALAEMSDEELAALLQASNTPNRSALVQQEMQRAQGAMDEPIGNYGTPGGAAMGGMATALRRGMGAHGMMQQRQQMERLMSGLEDPAAAQSILGAVGVSPKQKLLADALRRGGAGDAMMMPGMS